MKTTTIFIASMMLAPAVASAAKYGVAGCGLGSLVFGSGGSQTSAATTNGIVGNQLFGITTGTLNCEVEAGATATIDQEIFLKHNYASVVKQAAQGQGEFLSAFATVLGCEASAQPAFFEMVQKNHEQLFTDGAEAPVVLDNVKQKARAEQGLAEACYRI